MPNGQAALEDGKANRNLPMPMPVEEAAPPVPVVPVTTVPTRVPEPTAESVDAVALVTVLDAELDAAKSEDTAPTGTKALKAADKVSASKTSKVKKAAPKKTPQKAKRVTMAKPSKSKGAKEVQKATVSANKAARDKKHHQDLLSLGVPPRLLSKGANMDAPSAVIVAGARVAAGLAVASCSSLQNGGQPSGTEHGQRRQIALPSIAMYNHFA